MKSDISYIHGDLDISIGYIFENRIDVKEKGVHPSNENGIGALKISEHAFCVDMSSYEPFYDPHEIYSGDKKKVRYKNKIFKKNRDVVVYMGEGGY